jgi:ketosteroid isomerase-like protein
VDGLKVKKMGAPENKELIRNMFVEMSKGNAEAFLGNLADNVRYTVIGTTKYSGTFNGKQEFIKKALAPLFAQLDGGIGLTVDNFIADGDYVAMQARGKSNTKGGGTYNNTYCYIFRIANGKAQEATEYLDTELVTRAFGK